MHKVHICMHIQFPCTVYCSITCGFYSVLYTWCLHVHAKDVPTAVHTVSMLHAQWHLRMQEKLLVGLVAHASLDHVVHVLAEKVKAESETSRGAETLLKLELPYTEGRLHRKRPAHQVSFRVMLTPVSRIISLTTSVRSSV